MGVSIRGPATARLGRVPLTRSCRSPRARTPRLSERLVAEERHGRVCTRSYPTLPRSIRSASNRNRPVFIAMARYEGARRFRERLILEDRVAARAMRSTIATSVAAGPCAPRNQVGLVHRDVKPENNLHHARWSREVARHRDSPTLAGSSQEGPAHRRHAALHGSGARSWSQCRNSRSDVWSLGVGALTR
jgi:hypothetical protein